MYPGEGAPLEFTFKDVRATIQEIRTLINQGTIKKHPEGGTAFIEGYDDGIWRLFGRLARGLRAYVLLAGNSRTGDGAVLNALNELMWRICGFRVEMHGGDIALLNLTPLQEALDGLERSLPSIKPKQS